MQEDLKQLKERLLLTANIQGSGSGSFGGGHGGLDISTLENAISNTEMAIMVRIWSCIVCTHFLDTSFRVNRIWTKLVNLKRLILLSEINFSFNSSGKTVSNYRINPKPRIVFYPITKLKVVLFLSHSRRGLKVLNLYIFNDWLIKYLNRLFPITINWKNEGWRKKIVLFSETKNIVKQWF